MWFRPATVCRLLAVALLCAPRAVSATPLNVDLGLGLRSQEDVRLAIEGALRRLDAPPCRGLLDELRDERGRPLALKLESVGLDARGYLASMYFEDGEDLQACHTDSITVAFTRPGSRVVYICSRRFSDSFPRSSTAAEVSILHEFLHSLGLGENPPSPSAISRMVRDRCGD